MNKIKVFIWSMFSKDDAFYEKYHALPTIISVVALITSVIVLIIKRFEL